MKHNGELVSDKSFGEDKVSCMLKIIKNENNFFLVPDHFIGFPIFCGDKTDGLRSIEVLLDGPHIMLPDGRFLRSSGIGNYTPIDFRDPPPSTWEKFNLIDSFNN